MISSKSLHFDLVKKSYSHLSNPEKHQVLVISSGQVALALFDAVGVSFFGAIASLVMSSVNSQPPANLVRTLLIYLNLDSLSLQFQTAGLAIIGVLILSLKTYLSYKLSDKILRVLSVTSARLSSQLLSKLFDVETNYLRGRTTQSILYDVTTGVSVLTVGVLGIATTLLSDIALLAVIFAGVFYINISVALFTGLMFTCILFLLRKYIDHQAHRLSSEVSNSAVQSNATIVEILENLATISVSKTGVYFENKVFTERKKLNNLLAKQTLLPNIGKSVLEVSVLLGVLIISGLEFLFYDSKHAILNLSIFLIAASRITPAVLRIQYGLLQIKSSAGTSDSALILIELLDQYEVHSASEENGLRVANEALVARNLEFAYPGSEFSIYVERIHVKSGEFVAIVGPSGGGKSTMLKILTGLIRQDNGSVRYQHKSVRDFLNLFPGRIAYVPQHVGIVGDTLETNINLGREISMQDFNRCLDASDLSDWKGTGQAEVDLQLQSSPETLSGGQRQRIGICRALVSNPDVLFLDEATSAIDGHSEQKILKNLRKFNPNLALIVVAHRLSSIKDADRVLYIDQGKVIAEGTFEEVRGKVEAFDRQAIAMGL